MLTPPKSYNEMLPMLYKATFITTCIFYSSLVVCGYIPLVGLNAEYISPLKECYDFFRCISTFGMLPIFSAVIWTVVNGAFDLHNVFSKILGIRWAWEKYLIIQPLARAAGINRTLNKEESCIVMKRFYYPEVGGIDSHYVELFWNKVYYFWVFFDHTVIVFFTAIFLGVTKKFRIFDIHSPVVNLWMWFLFLVFFDVLVFILSVKGRTKDQVKQIKLDNITTFFRENISN